MPFRLLSKTCTNKPSSSQRHPAGQSIATEPERGNALRCASSRGGCTVKPYRSAHMLFPIAANLRVDLQSPVVKLIREASQGLRRLRVVTGRVAVAKKGAMKTDDAAAGSPKTFLFSQ